jgi:hypothetical protein
MTFVGFDKGPKVLDDAHVTRGRVLGGVRVILGNHA